MKRLLRLAMRLYPAAWRQRYGAEFQYLLDDVHTGWRDLLDILKGGLKMRLAFPSILRQIEKKEHLMMHFLRNHKALAGLAVVAVLLIGGWFEQAQPEYEASTVFLANPGKAADGNMLSPASLEGNGRAIPINAMMSNTHLQRIIDTYNLYSSWKGHKTQDENIQRMRDDIKVEVVRGPDFAGEVSGRAFRMTYRGRNPQLVAQVANQLASLFIAENLTHRTGMEGNLRVLDNRLDTIRKQLVKQEADLRTAKSPEERAVQARDLALLRDYYAKLFIQRQEQETVEQLERAERFTIVDPARIPEKPARMVPPFLTAAW